MAVKKITWKELMNNLQINNFFNNIAGEVQEIDSLFNELFSENYQEDALFDLLVYIKANILVFDLHNEKMWDELPIYVSSYEEKDRRYLLFIRSKLREYVAFYKKILTDEGVQRHLVYSKSYENDGNSNNTDRNINSDVPQNSNLYDSTHPESNDKFDQAIADYASSIAKNKAYATSHTEGTSGTTVSGTTWEEEKKNIQLMFYNELKDYIMMLPEIIYHWYSLDTIPAPELCKQYFKHLHEVAEMISHE